MVVRAGSGRSLQARAIHPAGWKPTFRPPNLGLALRCRKSASSPICHFPRHSEWLLLWKGCDRPIELRAPLKIALTLALLYD